MPRNVLLSHPRPHPEVPRSGLEGGLKPSAEGRKLARDATIAPYTAIFAAFTAGAAMLGAVVTLVKIPGP
ncbi:hypothetical protein [Methylobacterium sp. Gmos1]